MCLLAVPCVLKLYNWWNWIYRCCNTSTNIYNDQTCLFEDLINYNGLVLKVLSFMIYNGNRTEWCNLIWNHTRFENTSIISDKNCTTEVQLPLNYSHFKKGQNSVSANIWSNSQVVKKCKQKGFYISFCTRNRNNAIWSEMVRFKTEITRI